MPTNREILIDIADAFNKTAYKVCGHNIKNCIISTYKKIPKSWMDMHPDYDYLFQRGIYLASVRNSIGHGNACYADVSISDICVFFEMACVGLYGNHPKMKMKLKGNSISFEAVNFENYITKNFTDFTNDFKKTGNWQKLVYEARTILDHLGKKK